MSREYFGDITFYVDCIDNADDALATVLDALAECTSKLAPWGITFATDLSRWRPMDDDDDLDWPCANCIRVFPSRDELAAHQARDEPPC